VRSGLEPVSFRADATHFHHVPSILTLDIGAATPATFVSVHLCPDHPDARRLEASRLANLLAPDRVVIIGGDFNSPSPDDPPVDFAALAPRHRVHYQDASGDADRSPTALVVAAGLRELRGDDTATVPTTAYPNVEFVPFRADHIFVTPNVSSGPTRVLVDERTERASDHYPVIAAVEIP
jgi:endonuclease/exonuclease/phosphatase family metal-dependent hydrolase